jgi:hypothetical protein|tara:strand:+ start:256 stop:513 length:258 start_codon:yes stop_codon:yes gene_type:complete
MSRALGVGAVDGFYNVGAEVITDTATHTGRFKRIDFFENTHITTLASENYTGNSLDGESFPVGFIIEGVFTSIKLQNGACIAYRV